MTIAEIVQKVNKTKEFEDTIEISQFAVDAFDFSLNSNYYYEQTRLIAYYIGDWQCTDTRVGYRVYFFDDKPVAISSRLNKKMSEDFKWLSEEDYYMVKNYVMTFDNQAIPLANLDEELGESYKLSFYGQMYSHHIKDAIYKSKHVTIVDHRFGDLTSSVQIEYPFGKRVWVDIDELSFSYNLQK
jgi:hypothetical protein